MTKKEIIKELESGGIIQHGNLVYQVRDGRLTYAQIDKRDYWISSVYEKTSLFASANVKTAKIFKSEVNMTLSDLWKAMENGKIVSSEDGTINYKIDNGTLYKKRGNSPDWHLSFHNYITFTDKAINTTKYIINGNPLKKKKTIKKEETMDDVMVARQIGDEIGAKTAEEILLNGGIVSKEACGVVYYRLINNNLEYLYPSEGHSKWDDEGWDLETFIKYNKSNKFRIISFGEKENKKAKKTPNTTYVKSVLDSMGDSFFSIKYKTKDGRIKEMNCRTGVSKYTKGIEANRAETDSDKGLITLYSLSDQGYRRAILENIMEIRGKGAVITFKKE